MPSYPNSLPRRGRRDSPLLVIALEQTRAAVVRPGESLAVRTRRPRLAFAQIGIKRRVKHLLDDRESRSPGTGMTRLRLPWSTTSAAKAAPIRFRRSSRGVSTTKVDLCLRLPRDRRSHRASCETRYTGLTQELQYRLNGTLSVALTQSRKHRAEIIIRSPSLSFRFVRKRHS